MRLQVDLFDTFCVFALSSNLEPDKDMRRINIHRFLFMAIKKLLVITNYYKHWFYSVNIGFIL